MHSSNCPRLQGLFARGLQLLSAKFACLQTDAQHATHGVGAMQLQSESSHFGIIFSPARPPPCRHAGRLSALVNKLSRSCTEAIQICEPIQSPKGCSQSIIPTPTGQADVQGVQACVSDHGLALNNMSVSFAFSFPIETPDKSVCVVVGMHLTHDIGDGSGRRASRATGQDGEQGGF